MKLFNTIKTVVKDTAQTCSSKVAKAAVALSLLVGSMAANVVPASADLGTMAGKVTESKATGMLGNFVDIIKIGGGLVGAVLAVWGGIQFALAMRNEDAEGKTKASHTAIAGAITILVSVAGAKLLEEFFK